MEAEIKIQLLNGNQLSYVGLNEFISLISLKIKNSNSFSVLTPQHDANQFMKIQEVCNLLRISKPTIYNWIEKGILTPIKIQGRVYYNREDVLKLLETNKKG
ncbi:MAG: helix-turn-helix domain-containing protein [Flavobacteriales bacterium]|nr:helix-turn-helix domain-containing protein [Flavobacteriales bacterium]MCL4857535.1 helix-turn-helix domain-containing protein [Flavobacteriales bacterium]